MNTPASITITPILVADLLVEGERMPVYAHVIDGGVGLGWASTCAAGDQPPHVAQPPRF